MEGRWRGGKRSREEEGGRWEEGNREVGRKKVGRLVGGKVGRLVGGKVGRREVERR